MSGESQSLYEAVYEALTERAKTFVSREAVLEVILASGRVQAQREARRQRFATAGTVEPIDVTREEVERAALAKVAEAINENGHAFVTGASLGFGPGSVLHALHCCKRCGVVRNRDGKNAPCIGKANVELRETGE